MLSEISETEFTTVFVPVRLPGSTPDRPVSPTLVAGGKGSEKMRKFIGRRRRTPDEAEKGEIESSVGKTALREFRGPRAGQHQWLHRSPRPARLHQRR